MIRIALCDDDQKILNYLEERITWYAEEKAVSLYIKKFCFAKELEMQLEKNQDYQIYFLDILMPDINGIEIGKVIRKQNEKAFLEAFGEFICS